MLYEVITATKIRLRHARGVTTLGQRGEKDMAIEQAVIDQAKRTDLVALVKAKGIELKKNGKGYFGLCPFHADKNPSLSINPSKNLWQCFGVITSYSIHYTKLYDENINPKL